VKNEEEAIGRSREVPWPCSRAFFVRIVKGRKSLENVVGTEQVPGEGKIENTVNKNIKQGRKERKRF
jgi:hypothetical protein